MKNNGVVSLLSLNKWDRKTDLLNMIHILYNNNLAQQN